MSDKINTKRIFYLDVVKFVAIGLVVLGHAVNRSYTFGSNQMSEFMSIPLLSTTFKGITVVASRMGPPLFLMVSGALILKKDFEKRENILHFYRHNLLSLLITAEIWYAIIYIMCTVFSEHRHDHILYILRDLIKTCLFIDQRTLSPMWYIPMILAIYLVAPFFAIIIKKVSLRTLVPACVLVVICDSLIPSVTELVCLFNKSFTIHFALNASNIFSKYLVYMFIGYWLSVGGLKTLNIKMVMALFLVSFSLVCAVQIFGYSRSMQNINLYNVGMYFRCTFLFELIRRKGEKLKPLKTPISYVAQISFGIYLVHICVMEGIQMVTPIARLNKPIRVIVFELTTLCLSIVGIRIFSRIQLLKKYVFRIQ